MTDGLVSGEGLVTALKVETTPHDVTIAFVDILEAAREALGFADLRSLLAEVEVIRWSSTITSNVLAQRTGPKLGLLVTAGHEHDLYDREAAATVVGTLVSAQDISGIPAQADEQTVRLAIKSLLDRGIRRINVSLAGAFGDAAAEQRVVEMIAADYPDQFLGSIPALAGSEITLRPDDATRTIASLINAYVHPALATTLYRAEEVVRDQHGWRGNVLIGHINGGVARIGKTKAFDTIESGPLFGTHAWPSPTTPHPDPAAAVRRVRPADRAGHRAVRDQRRFGARLGFGGHADPGGAAGGEVRGDGGLPAVRQRRAPGERRRVDHCRLVDRRDRLRRPAGPRSRFGGAGRHQEPRVGGGRAARLRGDIR